MSTRKNLAALFRGMRVMTKELRGIKTHAQMSRKSSVALFLGKAPIRAKSDMQS